MKIEKVATPRIAYVMRAYEQDHALTMVCMETTKDIEYAYDLKDFLNATTEWKHIVLTNEMLKY